MLFGNRQLPLTLYWIRINRGILFYLCAGLILTMALLAIPAETVWAQTPTPTPENPPPTQTPVIVPLPPGTPPGFVVVDSALGVILLKKDYPGGNPDYVQLVDLSQGAYLELMYGDITDPRPTKGVYGGADPRMTSLAIQTYWDQARQDDPNAFCVINGQFFYMPEYPTRLAFPLKVNGAVISDGWGIDTYPDQKLILELWSDQADIVALSQGSLNGSTAPNLIGGLAEQANKRAKYSVGRTFVGVKDGNGDGTFETVLVYNTLSALQSGAADTLRSFGAEKVMMLDGGGSTQLLCKSGWWVRTDRPIPQALAIIAASVPRVSGRIVSYSDWPVMVEGDRLPINIEIENTGVVSWTPETTNFVIQADRLEFQQQQPAVQVVEPGGSTTISQTVPLVGQSGVLPVQVDIQIDYLGKIYPIDSVDYQTIVLPYQLRQRQADLQTELSDWTDQNPDQVGVLANDWIDRQLNQTLVPVDIQPANEIRALDMTFIPLLMLPVMALIAWAIARTRH